MHPFVLMSFNNNYESVSTVAHEWGHAMHSVLANAAQPYETANYGIFVAEIPSTTNEMLLGDYVARNAKTKAREDLRAHDAAREPAHARSSARRCSPSSS